MLIVTRKVDEKIIIGDNIIIKVCKISGNYVQIGIEADESIKVYREELYKKILEEKNKKEK